MMLVMYLSVRSAIVSGARRSLYIHTRLFFITRILPQHDDPLATHVKSQPYYNARRVRENEIPVPSVRLHEDTVALANKVDWLK